MPCMDWLCNAVCYCRFVKERACEAFCARCHRFLPPIHDLSDRRPVLQLGRFACLVDSSSARRCWPSTVTLRLGS